MYIVNFAQFIAFGLLPIAYFIIFSDLLSSFLLEISWVNEHSGDFIGSRWFSVLILAVLVFPLVIKKRITELKVAGVLLFTGVSLFIILMFVLRIFSADSLNLDQKNFDGFYKLVFDKKLFASLSNAFVAYGFQSAFYPVYNSLEKRTYQNGMKFTVLGMGFSCLIYISIMFVTLYSFGSDINGDVLNNLHDVSHWESYVLRAIFLLVISTHTPFIFFIGKESVLAIVALIVLPNKKDPLMETYDYEEEDNEDTHNQSKAIKSAKSQPFKHMDYSKRVISSSVDYNITLALPFYNKSIKTLVVPSSYENTYSVHDVIPNWLYYSVTLPTYAIVIL